jgi:hypothetical protein
MKADPAGQPFFICRVGREHDLTDRKEVIVHGKITAGSEERGQKAEKQKEVVLYETKTQGRESTIKPRTIVSLIVLFFRFHQEHSLPLR